MARDIEGNNGNNGVTVNATGATTGNQITVNTSGGVDISGSGRVDDIDLKNGNNTLIISGANRDSDQPGVRSSDQTTIGDIRTDNGDDFVSITDSGGRSGIRLGGGDDTLILESSYFQSGVDMGSGNDLVQVKDGGAPDARFSSKSPFAINGGSGVDTLELYGDFSVSLTQNASVDTNGDGTFDKVTRFLTRDDLTSNIKLPASIAGSATVGNEGLRFDFSNFEDLRGFICFARGTTIRTPRGEVAIESLRKGDLVTTQDGAEVAIRWIGSRKLDAIDLAANAHIRPVRISAGALGGGLPEVDLIVSPQHRILVTSDIAERMVGTREVLVAAKQLVGAPGIAIAEDIDTVEYFHFLLDTHRVVWSNGALSESMYTGLEALRTVSAGARQEIYEIFPELEGIAEDMEPVWQPAAFLMPGRLARSMRDRHIKTGKPLSLASH